MGIDDPSYYFKPDTMKFGQDLIEICSIIWNALLPNHPNVHLVIPYWGQLTTQKETCISAVTIFYLCLSVRNGHGLLYVAYPTY